MEDGNDSYLFCLYSDNYFFSRPEATESIQIIKFQWFTGLFSTLNRMAIDLPENQFIEQPVLWLMFFIPMFLVYFIGSFGVRVVFIKYIFDFFKKKISNPTIIFLLSFIVSGFLVSEFLFIGKKINSVNNGRWFSVQSLYVASFFIFLMLINIKNNLRRRIVVILVLLFAFGGTYSFLEFRNTKQYINITHRQLELSTFIENNIYEEVVMIEPLHYSPSVVSHLSGKYSLLSYYVSFAQHRASKSVIMERFLAIENFYNREFKGSRSEILQEFNVDYFVVTRALRGFFKQMNLGEKVFDNGAYMVFKVNIK